MNDFLPPWLRDTDDEEKKPAPAPPPPPPPPPTAADEGGLPPWLTDKAAKPQSMIKATGELSDEFLAAGDDLADTIAGGVTYDQWMSIQNEKKRPKSLDEEIPDLLQDLPPASSPFPEGTIKLPDTGELPNWFLGLEELDDEQAPAWFTEQQAPPVASAPPPPPVAAAPSDPLDSFFAGIGEGRAQKPAALTPDLFAAVMQPDPVEDSGAYVPIDVSQDSALDDFYSSLGAGQAGNAAPDRDESDDFFAEFGQKPLGGTAVEPLPTLDIDFGDDSQETPSVPLNPTKPLNLPEAIDFEFEQTDDSDYYEPTMPSKATLRSLDEVPVADDTPMNAESLSWLNEINSMIGSVVSEESRRADDDSDEFVSPPQTGDFDQSRTPTGSLRRSGQTDQLYEEMPPDWLSQLGALPDVASDQGIAPPPPPASNRSVDVSQLDFGADMRSTDTPSPDVDPFADLYRAQTPAQQEQAPKRQTNGGTVILPDDSYTPEVEEAAPPAPPPAPTPRGTYQLPAHLDRLSELHTDELDASLFGDALPVAPPVPRPAQPPPQPPAKPAPPMQAARQTPVPPPIADEPLLPFDDYGASPISADDDYFTLAELTDSYPQVVVEPEAPVAAASVQAPVEADEEDLNWLQSVQFEDTAPMPPVDDVAIQAPVAPPPTPPVAKSDQPKGVTDNLSALFASLYEEAPAAEVVPPAPIPVPRPLEPAPALYEIESPESYTGALVEDEPLFDDTPALYEFDAPESYTGALVEDEPHYAAAELSPEDALASLLESFAPTETQDAVLDDIRVQDDTNAFASLFGDAEMLEDAALPESSYNSSAPVPTTGELNALFDTFADDIAAREAAAPPPEDDFAGIFNTPAPTAPPSDALDIDALLGGLDTPTEPTPPDDAFSALFDTPTQLATDSLDIDALLSDLGAVANTDLAPPQPTRLAASTGELSALFDAFDDSADTDPDPFANPAAQQERSMPSNDDFDALFADLGDDKDNGEDADQLPSTGMLAGISSTDETQAVAPDDGDLEALFAAYETEQRAPDDAPAPVSPPAEPADNPFDFPDDDSFFGAMGLDASPPPPPATTPPDDDLSDDDFLRSFSQPEASNTADASGSEPSLWEDETEALDWNSLASSAYKEAAPVSAFEEEFPHIDAFDFDAEREAAAVAEEEIAITPAASASDWFADEEASPAAPISISDWDPPPAPVASVLDTSTLPEWLGELDTIGAEIQAQAAAQTEPEAPVDLEGYIAGLDSTGTLLPHSANLNSVATTTDEIDIDALFSDEMMLDVPDLPTTDDDTLAQSDMLGELQASVGEVSAAAMTRQLQDRPEGELSDRLKKLRIRGTEEIPAVVIPPQDTIADVLPGVSDVLAPAPFVVETSNLVGGALLRDSQKQHVALLRDLLGVQEGDAPASSKKLSAIDLTYEAPHLRDVDDDLPAPAPVAAPTFVPAPVRRQRTYRIDRLLISLLLAAGIILPFYLPEARIGSPPPVAFADDSREAAGFERIDALEEYDLVLVGLDYSPAAASELDEMTASLVRHILLRGARPVFISSNPFGSLRAGTFMDRLNADDDFLDSINQRVPLERNVEYYVAQFLPGSAVGLRAFGEGTADLLRLDISGQATGLNLESLSNFALILLITDRAEEVRAYAEQIAPLARRPLVVAINYASAPLTEPYAAMESVVDGLLVGYEDATTYAGLLGDVDAVERGARPLLPEDVTTPDDAPPPDNPDATAEPSGETDPNATPAPDATAAAADDVPQFTAIVTSADGANLRSGPGTDFTRVIGLARNSELIVLGFSDDNEWVNVQTADGTEGWVSAGLIVVNEAQAEATPTESAAASAFMRAFAQADDDAAAPANPRWYAMTMGILLSALIIGLGAITGILRGIFSRRAR